jgi:glycerol-1-phosphate dehydrogenase [NAD(P)+]
LEHQNTFNMEPLMDHDPIQQVLMDVSETEQIELGAGNLTRLPEIFKDLFPNRKAVIVADENTFRVAGREALELLTKAGLHQGEPVIYPGQPMLYASFDNVLRLEETLRGIDAIPVAVGSGTINDLTKLSSHRLGRRYMVVATAASMDGYTASGASISMDGFKQTFSCAAPLAVLADPDVMIKAPKSMTASGYADLLAKNVAGADWIIADALGVEPVNQRTWDIVQGYLRESTEHPELLAKGDPKAFSHLVRGLMLSGLSLQHYQASRPASGAEHLISHLWEMAETTHGQYSHGLKVGLGTIASAAMYDRLLTRELTRLNVDRMANAYPSREEVSAYIRKSFDNPRVVESAIEQSMAKYPELDVLKTRLSVLKANWPVIKEKLQKQIIPAKTMGAMLDAAGCITHPSQMGKTSADILKAYRQARLIRNRYTVLDLAEEAGCLEDCLNELFAPGGFWAA